MSETNPTPLHLVVLAGGLGLRARRSDSTAPKQFRAVGGRMLVMWSVRELIVVPGTASLTVTVPEPWLALAEQELDDFFASRTDHGIAALPHALALAGDTRTASTWSAVSKLAEEFDPAPDDLVAVHDAARPFATAHLLRRLCEAAGSHGGAVPGVAVPDTIVRMEEVEEGRAGAVYLERETLQAVQTPQVFRWGPFRDAHAWAHEEMIAFTDDGGLMASRGHPPVVVMGETDNWKVTTEGDWTRAEAMLRAR